MKKVRDTDRYDILARGVAGYANEADAHDHVGLTYVKEKSKNAETLGNYVLGLLPFKLVCCSHEWKEI